MTNVLTFPGLGLEFELDRVAFTLMGKEIYWYGIIIAAGFLLAVAYCYWRAPRYGVNQEKLMDLLFPAVPACIIGARAYYVIFNPSVCFREDGSFTILGMIAVWDGGLAIYGAVIVAIITAAIYCRVRRMSFWDVADIGALGVMIGQLVGRWGNFVNVECFGGVTDAPWRMCSPSIASYLWQQEIITTAEEYESVLNGTLGVQPTFFYESAWNLIGFLLMAVIARRGRKCHGQNFAGYLIWYGLGRAVIEGMRTDSLYFFGTGIRSSQMVGIVSVIAGAAVLAFCMKKFPVSAPASGGTAAAQAELEECENGGAENGGGED